MRTLAPFVSAILLSLGPLARAQSWTPPDHDSLVAPVRGAAPILACTTVQLARLRQALRAGERPVVRVVEAARAAATTRVDFPPRGGQHNQWYQCDDCQRALVTVDAAHHRCPGCAKVYSGPPYDDVVMSRVHAANLHRARQAAWSFALTGERAFADDAGAILTGYADRYLSYPHHSNAKDPTVRRDSGGHLAAQTLSEASLLVRDIAPALDLVWPALDAAQRAHVLEGLVRPMVENLAKCRRGKSNWQSWHNAAMFCAGALLGDAAWLRRSVRDERHGFLFQMGASVSADGMWYENSFGYHIYTLAALTAHADAARACGVDLFGHPTLRAMCALLPRYAMADGRLPRLGDDVDSSPERASESLEAAFAATGDERLRAVLPGVATWDSIRHGRDVAAPVHRAALRSEVLTSSGHAILRAAGGRASALLTFAPFGGFHDHFDRLSFVWYAHGAERGVDPGRAKSQAYRLPIHRDWYRASLAHNTVLVDGRSQCESGGELLAFVDGDGFAAAAARTTTAWRDVAHRRCLIFTGDCLVVLDRLTGAAEHTFDWLYHDRSDLVASPDATAAVAAPLGLHGEQFVRWLGAGDTTAGPTGTFTADDARTMLAMAADGPSHVRIGTGPLQSVDDRAPLLLVRRRGRAVTFASVLAAAPSGEPAPLAGIASRQDGDALVVEVRIGDATRTFTWDFAATVRRR